MGSLADFFPESFREEYSNRKLTVGSVLLIHDPIAGKEKFHIIVGFDNSRISTASVRINSEKNKNVFRTSYLESLCVTVKETNYLFLDYDSIVDCSKLVEWETSILSTLLTNNPDILKGNLNERDLGSVCSVLATAKTIEPKKRKKYGLQ